MSFQFYALYPSLNVRENLAYPLHAEGLDAGEIKRRVGDISRILQLEEVLHRTPGQLAEGEKQRVAVGRSIIRDAVCFLFDEPLSRLDVQLRETMRGEIKEVLEGLNKPTVIVTHDQLEALTMADRIAVMRDGLIEQVASPHEIFARPANLFVAGFIGTPQMNLLPANLIERTAEGINFEIGTQKVLLPIDGATGSLRAGDQATIGLRPRAFEPVQEASSDTLSASVDIIEPMGAETLLHLTLGDQELRVVVDRTLRPPIGDTLHLRCRPSQLHLFGKNGQRINLSAKSETVSM
jgi:ABC-type sugar transport system ATPase subunit